VTVVFTAAEGTPAALRVASGLAQNLGARIRLIVTEVVPFCFPLDKPPVSVDFLERRPLALVSESEIDESDMDEPDIEESDIDAEEVNIEIYLCRDRREYLRLSLKPRSLVVIAGRGRWWFRQAEEGRALAPAARPRSCFRRCEGAILRRRRYQDCSPTRKLSRLAAGL
jgi:hypothetical protein